MKAPSVKANIVTVVDSEEEQAVIEGVDTTHPEQLPDLPPAEQILINQPNLQQKLPAEQADQPNQLNLVSNQQNQLNNQDNNQNLLPNQPQNPENPLTLMAQQLNWSYFKPGFSGKSEEDAEAHLLRTNDWMETCDFPQDPKVRRFFLTLMGEATLWYETLRPIQIDWDTLQGCFQQQYSKFGSTREQYFHVWRSFHFDENVDTIDSYITRVKEVAALLNYGEPQILELFKNTLPSRQYYMLYQRNDLRTAIETAKSILTKEKLDKQKAGQSSASPFMKASQENSKKNSERAYLLVHWRP